MITNRSIPRIFPVVLNIVIMLALVIGSAAAPVLVRAATTITVSTSGDDTASDTFCSLREAIINANDDAATYGDCDPGSGNDTILFADGITTITLGSTLPSVTDSEGLTIDGGGDVTISGADLYRIFFVDASPLTLTLLTLAHGKSVSGVGGGVYNTGTLAVTKSTFSGNNAINGGGIYNSGTLAITNNTFSGNSANVGGGVYNYAPGTLTVTNNTFSGNSATTGGDIYQLGSSSTLNLYNTILANSVSGGDCYNSGGTVTGSDNLIEDAATACGFSNGVNGNVFGFDPNLGALTGSPAYFPLNGGSLAIDTGDDVICAAAPVNNTSQNGMTRPQGTHCEIGSFERPSPATITTITANQPEPSRVGQAVAVTVIVTGGTTAATGTVDITGADTNCTITLSGGSGSCNVNFASQGVKTLSAFYYGDGTHNPSSDTEGHIAALVKNLRSNGPRDGWILESGESTNAGGTMDSTATTLRMGDDASNKQYRSILSFNTATLPDDAVIASVLLQTTWESSEGAPIFTDFGGRSFVDVKNPTFGASVLELTDFIASPTVIAGGHQTSPIGNLYRAYFTAASYSSINLAGMTQIRIRFKLDDDNDHVADYFSFYSGDAPSAANRPLLQIMYYTP